MDLENIILQSNVLFEGYQSQLKALGCSVYKTVFVAFVLLWSKQRLLKNRFDNHSIEFTEQKKTYFKRFRDLRWKDWHYTLIWEKVFKSRSNVDQQTLTFSPSFFQSLLAGKLDFWMSCCPPTRAKVARTLVLVTAVGFCYLFATQGRKWLRP